MPLIHDMTQTIRRTLGTGGGGTFGGSVGSGGFSVATAAPRLPLVVIYHLDTNRGDATIIMGSTKCMFVDTGFDWVGTRMLEIEQTLNGTGPHYVAISHFDKDHFYGIGAVTRASARALTVITPADPDDLEASVHLGACAKRRRDQDALDPDLASRFQILADLNGYGSSRSCLGRTCTGPKSPTAHVLLTGGGAGTIQLGGGVTMAAVHNKSGKPVSVLRENNDSSIAWVLTAAGTRYYTAGDLEEGEDAVNPTGRFHIMKCGHHGSRAATSARFVAAANPVLAILQGCASDYGHPMPEVLERLNDANVRTLCTGLFAKYMDEVPLPTACDVNHTKAGDIAVVIWSDGVFSAHWMDVGGETHEAWDASGADATLGAPELSALPHLKLNDLTDLSKVMNLGLDSAKIQHAYITEHGKGGAKSKGRKAEGDREAKRREVTVCDLCLKDKRDPPGARTADCDTCGAAICAEHTDGDDCTLCAQY